MQKSDWKTQFEAAAWADDVELKEVWVPYWSQVLGGAQLLHLAVMSYYFWHFTRGSSTVKVYKKKHPPVGSPVDDSVDRFLVEHTQEAESGLPTKRSVPVGRPRNQPRPAGQPAPKQAETSPWGSRFAY